MSDLPQITTEALVARLAVPTPFHFWNVLTDDYFHGELIPGSQRLPSDRIGKELVKLSLPKDAEIVTYCAGPSCPQSRQAAEKLIALGYVNVRAYEGGVEAWKSAGHPTVTFAPALAA